MLKDCIDKALKTRRITPQQAEKIRKLAGEGEVDEMRFLDSFLQDTAELKRRTMLQVIANKKNLADVRTHPEGIGRGVEAKVVHDPSGKAPYSNIDYRQKSIRATFHEMLAGFMDRYRTKNLGFTQDRKGLARVIDELHGTATGDSDAKAFAKMLSDTAEYGRLRLNVAGGNVPHRKDFGWVHTHNAKKIARVSDEEWKEAISRELDPSRIFDSNGAPMSAERLDRLLTDLYQGFVEESRIVAKDTPRSIPNRADHRLLAFKDGPAWRRYNQEFGDPDLYHAIMGHFDQLAGDTGLMEILGSNPEAAMQTFIKMAADSGYPNYTKTLIHGMETIRNSYAVVAGRTNQVKSEWLANFEQGSRNFLSSVQLPSAFLTSFNDIWTQRMTRTFNGMPSVRILQELMKEMSPRNAAGRLFGVKLGLGAHSWITYALGAQRFQEITGAGWTARLSDFVFRASLLSPWSDGNSKIFGKEFLSFVADNAGRNYNDVNPLLKAQFGRYGITERHWEVIRRAPMVDFEGVKFLKPSNILELSRKEVGELSKIFESASEDIKAEMGLRGKREGALGRRLKAAGREAEAATGRISFIQDAANRFHEMVLTEMDFALVVPDARIRGIATQGRPRGDLYGEIARDVAMYKQFPVSMLTRHLARGATAIDGLARTRYLTELAVGMTLFGGIVLQSKAIRSGRDPEDMTTMQFWQRAFVQGGAGSIYADFLVDNVSRYGKGPVVSVIGPKAGVIDDLYLLTRGNLDKYLEGRDFNFRAQMIRTAKDYTPFYRVWYARVAFERLFWDQIQKAGDPEAHQSFRRIMQAARKNYDQDFWWRPGETLPTRAPDLGAALGK